MARFQAAIRLACRSSGSETRLSLVDLADLADAAAVVLMDDGHAGATYELAGTGSLSQTEVAAVIGAALGRNIRAEAENGRCLGGARPRCRPR